MKTATDYSKIKNSLERRATLIVEMLEDKAQRIVDALDEPPPGTKEPDPQTVREMWSFSPFGERAPLAFWALHDMALERLLQELAAAGDMPADQRMKLLRNAHQQAEATALGRVYPQRATLMMLGITTPERSVELATKAQRLVEQEDRKQGSPEMIPQQEAMTYG